MTNSRGRSCVYHTLTFLRYEHVIQLQQNQVKFKVLFSFNISHYLGYLMFGLKTHTHTQTKGYCVQLWDYKIAEDVKNCIFNADRKYYIYLKGKLNIVITYIVQVSSKRHGRVLQ